MTRSGAAFRVSAYYAAVFTAVGIIIPFWPVWLADHGLNATEIGMTFAVSAMTRVVMGPLVGHFVDRHGHRRRTLVLLATGATLAWLLFSLTEGFRSILVVTLIAQSMWAGLLPLGDGLAVMASGRWRLDYGRLRLWGSLAFIIAAVLGGRFLLVLPREAMVWLIALALGITALACSQVPEAHSDSRDKPALPVRPLLKSRAFLLFLAWAAANQAAHTLYYAFATLHWRAAGIGGETIGLLWSEGVVAEIILFAMAGAVVKRVGVAELMVIAGLAGILRWTVLGMSTAVPVLAVVQILHAGTFGCGHLAAMHFIQRAVPGGLMVRAQGLLTAVAGGLVATGMSPVAGWLYQLLGGTAFLVMSGCSALCAFAAWRLVRHWDGGRIVEG